MHDVSYDNGIEELGMKTEKDKLDSGIVKMAFIMVIGMFAPGLDSTIVNVAIQTISMDLHSELSTVQWVMTAYILMMGIAVPVSGWLADRFSGKKIYLYALVLFFAGSVLASLSWNIETLITARILQGIGAGIMMPVMQTFLVRVAGAEKLGRVMSVVSIPAAIIPIFGPVAGGIIVHNLPWQWIFYVNIPICLAALILSVKYLPADTAKTPHKSLDVAGLLLLTPAFVLILIAISQLRSASINSTIPVTLPVGAVLLAGFIVYGFKSKTCVLDIRLFKLRNFSASAVLIFVLGTISTGSLFILPLYFQQLFKASALTAGLLLAPQGLGILLSRNLAGKLTDKKGARPVLLLGLTITVIGTIPLALFDFHGNLIPVIVILLIRGAGLGFLNITPMVSIYYGLSKEEVSHGTTMARMLQQIGGAFGACILAVILHFCLGAAGNSANVFHAYSTVFWWSTGIAILSFVPALLLSAKAESEKAKSY